MTLEEGANTNFTDSEVQTVDGAPVAVPDEVLNAPVAYREVIDLGELDAQITAMLRELPQELALKWRDKYEESEDVDQFYTEFRGFYERRNNALLTSVEVFPQSNEIIREEVSQVLRTIKKTYGDSNYFLGNGAVAEVYELPVAPHLCVKYIHDQTRYNEGNHFRDEYSYLCELHDLDTGVRTPVPAFLSIHPSEGHVYGMEKIDGKSLSQILERPEDCKDLVDIAKQLNKDDEIQKLLDYLTLMHERKITHNDLFKRNVMLSREGKFFIIDFGKAKREQIGEDHEDKRVRDKEGLRHEIRDFFDKIDKITI